MMTREQRIYCDEFPDTAYCRACKDVVSWSAPFCRHCDEPDPARASRPTAGETTLWIAGKAGVGMSSVLITLGKVVVGIILSFLIMFLLIDE